MAMYCDLFFNNQSQVPPSNESIIIYYRLNDAQNRRIIIIICTVQSGRTCRGRPTVVWCRCTAFRRKHVIKYYFIVPQRRQTRTAYYYCVQLYIVIRAWCYNNNNNILYCGTRVPRQRRSAQLLPVTRGERANTDDGATARALCV